MSKLISHAYSFKGFRTGRVCENIKRVNGKWWGKVGKADRGFSFPKEIIEEINKEIKNAIHS